MNFKFQVQKAKREKVYAKVALMGSSGSGKSVSSLRLATGMVERMKELDALNGTTGKILLANTEGSRGKYYASEYDYDIVDLEPPFNPELFVDLINFAVDAKYSVLIIDSSSSEWEGKGGCLELQQQAGGTYQAWARVTPRHQKFVDALAYSPIHILSTMRSKDQYEVERDDKGKVAVRKIGLGAKQRDGFEYDFTCTFMIERDTHMAKPEKDNTHIFEHMGMNILDESCGKKIIDWANASEVESASPSFMPNASASNDTDGDAEYSNTEIADTIDGITGLVSALQDKGVERSSIANAIKAHHIVNGKASANYKTIADINTAKSVIAELEKLM